MDKELFKYQLMNQVQANNPAIQLLMKDGLFDAKDENHAFLEFASFEHNLFIRVDGYKLKTDSPNFTVLFADKDFNHADMISYASYNLDSNLQRTFCFENAYIFEERIHFVYEDVVIQLNKDAEFTISSPKTSTSIVYDIEKTSFEGNLVDSTISVWKQMRSRKNRRYRNLILNEALSKEFEYIIQKYCQKHTPESLVVKNLKAIYECCQNGNDNESTLISIVDYLNENVS